jgi:hypothetical protein
VKLPHGERAVVDPLKLTGYSLDAEHDEGRHKAHVFESVLGITRQNSNLLIDAIKEAAASGEAVAGKLDDYGQRYSIDFRFGGPRGTATIRSAWIVRRGESFPRLITCYIL